MEEAIQAALAEGRAPTKADVHYRVRFTGTSEWYTPVKYIELARLVLDQIDLDPASCDFAQRRVRASRYFTKADDGVAQPWAGKIFLNPPFGKHEIPHFVDKLVGGVQSGAVTEAIMLTNNSTDTAWFHHAQSACPAICSNTPWRNIT